MDRDELSLEEIRILYVWDEFDEERQGRRKNRSWNFVKILKYAVKLQSEVAGL
jgi:hypothetical protein